MSIPTIVLGGTGYVSGELLRLIAGHPDFELAAIMSDSQPGESVGKAFPHLASAYPETRFESLANVDKLVATTPQAAIFCAAPHGAAASLIDGLLKTAANAGTLERIQLRDSGASAKTRDATRGSSGLLCYGNFVGERAPAGIGSDSPHAVRLWCHGQHRFGS